MRWRKVTLVGVGLLGGSLGMALRKRGLAEEVCGYVRRETSIAECEQAGAVHRATTNLLEAVSGADLVVLCTPLFQMAELSRAMLPSVRKGALITDVGSVKGAVVEELEPIFATRGAAFVGSHPMAGSEKSGVSAARADLFVHAACVVTSTKNSDSEKVSATEGLWAGVGARVMRLSPKLHDELVSRTSHLPHVLAAQLAAFVLDAKHPAEQGKLCANGFRDSTRIASGSPEMWRDIVMMNRKPLLEAIGEFSESLEAFRRTLESGDSEEIQALFQHAKNLRDEWTGRCASSSPE
ncbi:MAG TPA: prephenate dehydrogenase/arogenate dehydrogenase family protein [Verrucomicrobiae bacterium]